METKKSDVMTSLNENSDMDLSIQQLEDRLETDPLAVSGLLNLDADVSTNVDCFDFTCESGFHIGW